VIRDALEEKDVSLYLHRVLHSYLSERWLCWVGRGGIFKRLGVTCGVPQGTVLLVTGDSLVGAAGRADLCVVIVVGEMRRLGLKVSPLNTQIVAFGGPPNVSGAVWVVSWS